ncbi:MAG: cellulase family glycosylhydrolase [Polyangiales bacterium]
MSASRGRSAAIAMALALRVGGASAQPADPRFVRVEGRHFMVGAERFRFLGANASVMHGRAHREALEPIFDAAVADGLRVVRVWALGERPDDAPAWTRDFAFRVGAEGWVEESFSHLDRVLEAARRRGLRVIVVLANRWGDYGGVPQYLEWTGLSALAQRALGQDQALARFFDDAEARAQYLAHAARVVTRVNALTGRPYRSDPTIMAWELINESDVAPRGREALLSWTRESARAIRALDGAHLVAAGHIGYGRRAQRETWLAVQSLPEVSYADAHAYPTRLPTARTPSALDDFIDDHASLARNVIEKPMVWGEFGFSTASETHLGDPRARWYERFLDRAGVDDADGALVWLYTTSRDPPGDHGIFADAGATGADDLRAAIRRQAARWREGFSETNPRLLARAAAPLWNTDQVLRPQRPRVAAARRVRGGVRWVIAPERFSEARAEALGRWDGYAVMHLWGSGVASVRYDVRTPPGVAASRLTLRARLSSELPGRGEGSTDEDVSRVRVLVDDAVAGELVAPRDDGAGRWVDFSSDAPAAVEALRQPGVHALRLEVVEGPFAHGLCVYGHATGREPPPPGGGPLPGRVVLTLLH